MSPPTSSRPALTGNAIRGGSVAAAVAQIVALSCPSQQAQAQTVPLLAQPLLSQYTPVERDFAEAVAKFANASATSNFFCNEGRTCDGFFATEDATFDLIGAADELTNPQGGEGSYSVPTIEAFNNVLRWLAPEELFALAPIATGFANGQLGTLESHLDNTRSVSRARLFANNVVSPTLKRGYAANAGAGSAGGSFSRLNLFFDASATFGDRDDTTDTGSENAFDFDGNELALGVDWRFSDNLVAGGLVGYTDRKVDFDTGKSSAGGKIDADGFSVLAFAQFDDVHWYGSVVAGYQKLSYDVTRRIGVVDDSTSGPFAPDSIATGSPDGSGILASLNAGLPFQWGGWGTDIFIKADWQKQSIDRFTENVNDFNLTSAYGYKVGKQDIKSLDTSLGFKVQYVATPSFGVIIPFLRAQFHQQLEDSAQAVDLEFLGLDEIDTSGFSPTELAAAQDAFRFQLRSDRPDKSWISAAAGVSAVLRGSSSVSGSGRGSGGLQGFLQYSTVFALKNYSNNAITAGLRYEF